jgi:hypothetical protein
MDINSGLMYQASSGRLSGQSNAEYTSQAFLIDAELSFGANCVDVRFMCLSLSALSRVRRVEVGA